MPLPLSPRASYLGWILLAATGHDTIKGRLETLRLTRDQALTDESLTPHDLVIVLRAYDEYSAAVSGGRIP